MIATVAVCKNEADIIELWIRHNLAEGVDRVYVSDGCSDDGTREILDALADETDQVTIIADNEPVLRQAYWTNLLAHMAGADGATWILPTDIDEFVYACDGRTLAETLGDCPHEKLYARMFQHLDWNTRYVEPKRLFKVAYRYSQSANVSMGNHEVNLGGGEFGVIDLREMQFRSFEHYMAKVAKNLATLDPVERALGNGAHYAWLENKGAEELRQQWEILISVPMIADPIPSHFRNTGSLLHGTDQ